MTGGVACGSCGTGLRENAKFCDECGAPTAVTGDTAEYKQVTALFADVVRSMHIAATDPRYIRKEDVTAEDLEREKDIYRAQAAQTGKPAPVIEKIVESGLKTYYKEVCLLEQAFIHDSGKSVAQAVKEAEGKVGGPIKVAGFLRYALGEGIEKQESDFAAEVAAASGQK